MALTLSTAARNAATDGVVDLVDAGATDAGGDLVIRDSGNIELVVFVLDATAFGNSATGTASAAGLPKTVSAAATGTADNALLRDKDNVDVITGLTVGTSGTDVVIDNTSINSGQDVTLNSLDYTTPAS